MHRVLRSYCTSLVYSVLHWRVRVLRSYCTSVVYTVMHWRVRVLRSYCTSVVYTALPGPGACCVATARQWSTLYGSGGSACCVAGYCTPVVYTIFLLLPLLHWLAIRVLPRSYCTWSALR